jgi:hypothetical protein
LAGGFFFVFVAFRKTALEGRFASAEAGMDSAPCRGKYETPRAASTTATIAAPPLRFIPQPHARENASILFDHDIRTQPKPSGRK